MDTHSTVPGAAPFAGAAAATIDAPRAPAVRRVLVALDESPHAARALEVATAIADACHAEVALLHVIDPHLFATPDGTVTGDVLREELERSGRALLGASADRVRARTAGSSADPAAPRPWEFLEYGRPAQEIARVAHEWAADVIVVGTRGHSTIGRALAGSTVEGVLSSAHRPVLVVPPWE